MTQVCSERSATMPKIVRDQQDAHLFGPPEGVDQFKDLGLDGDIQRGRRLVGYQERRAAGQGHGDHYPLAHAAAQLMGIVTHAVAG